MWHYNVQTTLHYLEIKSDKKKKNQYFIPLCHQFLLIQNDYFIR